VALRNDSGLTDQQIFDLAPFIRLELARRYAQEKRILEWGKVCFPDKFPLPFCHELHGYMVEIRDEPFSSTEAPRGYSKTTIECFLIPIFTALNEPEKYQHYLNVQSTEEKALAVNRGIKQELEQNWIIRALYGDQMGERWTDGQFVLKCGPVFTAVGAGQSIRGINYRNRRPDNVRVDDLYDDTDINNQESTKKKNEWFWGTLYPALAQSGRTSLHVQGTAINREDLLEELKGKPGIKCRTFQAVKDWDLEEVLWPELKTFESVMAEKALMPSVIWFREKQNERRDDSSSIIKLSYLAAWEYDPADLHRRIREGREIFLVSVRVGNDPSIGKAGKLEKPTSDFTGTALVLVTKGRIGSGNQFWIENLWNERLSLERRIRQLEQIGRSRPPDMRLSRVNIEAIAGFDDYATQVTRETNLPVRRIPSVKDKMTVLENKSHLFENGKVFLNKNIDQKLKEELVYQLTTNVPRHDDLRDGVFLALEDGSVDMRTWAT
jgi:hypothetical protein